MYTYLLLMFLFCVVGIEGVVLFSNNAFVPYTYVPARWIAYCLAFIVALL